jgi:DinB superfamily
MTFHGEMGAGSSTTLKAIWEANAAARAALCDEVRGLSDTQLGFRPAPRRWSIGEILDHLCLAERAMIRSISRLLQHAAGLGKIAEPGAMDAPSHQIDLDLYNQPAGAPESVLPSPDRPLERLLAGLEESRERLQEVTKRAEGRVVGNVTLPHFQLGELNFYQWLAIQGSHEAKHTAQIRRIKADPAFPKY